MRIRKKNLFLVSLLCIGCITFVGCSDGKQENSQGREVGYIEESVENTSENEIEGNTENQEFLVEESLLSEEEALQIVEKEVKKVFPNMKLMVEENQENLYNGFYTVTYDTPYYVDSKFLVDISTGEAFSCSESGKKLGDMKYWKEKINRSLSTEYVKMSAEEVKKLFVSMYTYNETHERAGWIHLSDSQLSNLEALMDEVIEYVSDSYGWVFRYPMEKEHEVGTYFYREERDND